LADKYWLRRLWITTHRWVGLTAGFVLVVIGLTGSVSVFWRELEQVSDARLAIEQPAENYRPYADMVAAVNAAFPGRQHEWYMSVPWYPSGVVYAVDHDPPERAGQYERPLYVAVDPFTARVTTHYFWGETPVSWLYNLHSHLNAGPAGMITVGVLGFLLLGLALSGLYLWWPITRFSRRQFMTTTRDGAARFEFDLHRVGGFYSLLLLVVMSITGIMLVFPDGSERVVSVFSQPSGSARAEGEAPRSTPIAGRVPVTADAAISRAMQIFPEARLRAFMAPGAAAHNSYGVILQQPHEIFDPHYPRTEVWVDQYSGDVIEVIDPRKQSAADRVLSIIVPLHGGEALGLTGRVLVCLAGFVPLLLFYTGIRQWLRRRRANS
jgi:uncharacterized iron-regulated membrane protein